MLRFLLIMLSLVFVIGENGFPSPPFQSAEPTPHTAECGRTFPKRLFILLSLGDAVAHDGTTRMAVRRYAASGGTTVSVSHATFGSRRLSTDELRYLATQATKVVERGPERARFGNTVGERVVLKFAGKAPDQDTAVVAWTVGRDLYKVSSHSIQVALDMEQRQPNQ